jgi:hypothetical protein
MPTSRCIAGNSAGGRHDPWTGDTHDVIHHGGQVVAVVVPVAEYQQLRQVLEEQRVNEEFEAARARYQARQEAGAIRYVSHEEARRRLRLPARNRAALPPGTESPARLQPPQSPPRDLSRR